MDSVLVVASSEKGRDILSELLGTGAFSQIITAGSGSEARRILVQNDFDLVVINAPLSDEYGHELALMAIDTTWAGVILIVKNEMVDEISAKVENFGVFVMGRPIGRQFFYQALKLMAASHKRITGLKNENIKLQKKIEDIRLIDRAKCVLIQYLNMTEPQAHRYIEKQAMDMRITRAEVAQGILKTYES